MLDLSPFALPRPDHLEVGTGSVQPSSLRLRSARAIPERPPTAGSGACLFRLRTRGSTPGERGRDETSGRATLPHSIAFARRHLLV
ncbi:hypothetical protein PoB_005380900 [Plakobranchus ocellatus]|uniref:Uncharacterized protein n=1 Tax=Plakobranchus ocellatus TaxID=259542 RepID=A0AAV4C430_9GAST|nr:hypothetical protein PoB_005380900 [Plakobranchus ocellatus]